MDLGFLKELKKAHLLIVGEVGIDEYLWGNTNRISPEAPVPVVEVEAQSYKLGLSGNVAQNLVSLGVRTTLLSICGEDEDSQKLKKMLMDSNIVDTHFISDPTRPTLRKTRVIAQKQHVVRVDYERLHRLEAGLASRFLGKLNELMVGVDGIIVQDYGKGLFNSDTMSFVKEAGHFGIPVFVDPSRTSPLNLYRGVTLLTPNLQEAEILCQALPDRSMPAGKNDRRLFELSAKILEITGSKHSLITCGEYGMVSVSRGEVFLNRIPTFAREVYDVTGAGDTVIAVLSLMYSLKYPLSQCMQVANAAAGLVVGRMGAASVTCEELKGELERLHKTGLVE